MRKFDFPIGVLIAAARLGWINCKNGIVDFGTLRALYTLLYAETKLNAIVSLAEMPDEFQRSEMHETMRISLVSKAQASLKKWRRLRRYVSNAYPVNERKGKLKAIGREFLKNALREDWTALESMLEDGWTFLSANETALQANSNMPTAFKDEYLQAKQAVIAARDAFYLAETNAKELTALKNAAANAVYDDLLVMLEDGQAVYDDNEIKRRVFVLQYLLDLVSPTGPAGLKGTAEINGQPAAGIIVELENKNLSVIVDAEGAFNFGENLASGTDRLIFKRGDQVLLEEEVDIPPGTTVTEHVELPAGS